VQVLAIALGAVALTLIVSEIGLWTERIAIRLIDRSTARLPKPSRERYRSEWITEMNDLGSGVAQLAFAAKLAATVPLLRNSIAGQKEPPSQEDIRRRYRRTRFLTCLTISILCLLSVGALLLFTIFKSDVSPLSAGLTLAVPAVLTAIVTVNYLRRTTRIPTKAVTSPYPPRGNDQHSNQ
jgi:hypothetical protein